jgi:glycosyltransferase involved in cell wall biosynthesis
MKLAIYNKGIPFDGATIATEPLGGSESGIIYMARELVRCGHTVTVYTNCANPAEYDGVTYRHYHAFFTDYRTFPWDGVIAFRSLDPMLLGRIAPRMIFWTGDAYDQPALIDFAHPAVQHNVDLVFCVSQWHRQTFIDRFRLSPDKVIATRNGFAPELLPARAAARTIASGVYTSTPFRGLKILLELFPEIRQRVPVMKLDVFSSMKVYGWTAEQDAASFGALYESAAQPGITWHGSVAQPRLLNHLASSGLLLYPNTFEETSCIAAIEAQAAGCVVVTSARGALTETVVDGVTGFCLKGDPNSDPYRKDFVEAATGLIQNEEMFAQMSEAARLRALRNYTWASIASEWTGVLESMEALPVSGRLTGPLSLLQLATHYLESGRIAAAQTILERLEDAPFFANEVQRLRTLIHGGTQSHGCDGQRNQISSPA